MNISDRSALRECTSCLMCAAVCPKVAISIELDSEGFYRPVVDENLCIDCNLCTKVCYKFDQKLKLTTVNDLMQIPLYAASAKNDALLDVTTSGGIADLLAHKLMNEGYKCIGVVYNDSQGRAEHLIAGQEADLVAFRGSKYIQSYTYTAFNELVKCCNEDRYAVFGTPCQIYAINQYLKQRKLRNQFVLIDLYCHGCPSLHIWTKYQREIKKDIRKPKFDSINFRSKVKGWGTFVIAIVVDGVKVFVSSPKKDDFYTLFFSDQILNNACHDCSLRSSLAYTDIRLGDFWGKKTLSNSRGVSAVSLMTPQAQNIFEQIKKDITYEKEDYAIFLPYQSWGKTYSPNQKLRKDLFDSLKNEALPIKAASKLFYAQQSCFGILKRYIKNIAYYLPGNIVKFLKRFA